MTCSKKDEKFLYFFFQAALDAGWLTTKTFFPEGTYVGFRTCSKSLEDFLSFLSGLETPCEAGIPDMVNLFSVYINYCS